MAKPKKSLDDTLKKLAQKAAEDQARVDKEQADAAKTLTEREQRADAIRTLIDKNLAEAIRKASTSLAALKLSPKQEKGGDVITLGEHSPEYVMPIISLTFDHPGDMNEPDSYKRRARIIFAEVEQGIVRQQLGIYATDGESKRPPNKGVARYSQTILWRSLDALNKQLEENNVVEEAFAEALDTIIG